MRPNTAMSATAVSSRLTLSNVCSIVMCVEELRGRWWNRAHGRMARKDLWLWQDGAAWIVGARHGDGDAEIWRRTFDRESVARVLIEAMMKRNGGRGIWLDLTNLATDSPRRRARDAGSA